MSDFELVEEVFGRQGHGRVIALGSRVTPTTFRADRRRGSSSTSSRSQQQAETERLTQENIRLQQDVTRMDRQIMEIRAEMDAHAQVSRQMADIIARMGHLPPPPPPS